MAYIHTHTYIYIYIYILCIVLTTVFPHNERGGSSAGTRDFISKELVDFAKSKQRVEFVTEVRNGCVIVAATYNL